MSHKQGRPDLSEGWCGVPGWAPVRVAQRALSWWCFNPGVLMRDMFKQGVHSLILTSGTLSPLSALPPSSTRQPLPPSRPPPPASHAHPCQPLPHLPQMRALCAGVTLQPHCRQPKCASLPGLPLLAPLPALSGSVWT